MGIGTSSIDYTAAGRTVVHVEGSAGALLAMEDTGARSYFFQSGNDLFLENDTASGSMIFGTNNSTARMSITSSGNVGIGTSSPSYPLTVDGYIGVRSGNGITFLNPSNNYTSDIYNGASSGTSDLRFKTQATERMRIDSSGNLLVGTTGTDTVAASGFNAQPDGQIFASSDSQQVLTLTRRVNDGEIVRLRKSDGSTVGSIGTLSSRLHIENGDTGLRIAGDLDQIFPCGSGGGDRGSAIDLGSSGVKFKDAHFSGTVNAANFNTTSDATLKTNVETLTGSLDAVKSLRGVSFDWLENGNSEVGVIAQEVEAVLPDVVSTNDQGIKSVKYGNMVAVLIEAIKEQQAQIDELKAQLNS